MAGMPEEQVPRRSFYAFYDRYQAIQGQKETSWLDDIPCRLVLTRNCRNTDQIARAAYRAAGLPISPNLGISGRSRFSMRSPMMQPRSLGRRPCCGGMQHTTPRT